jgi:hypothetical protein
MALAQPWTSSRVAKRRKAEKGNTEESSRELRMVACRDSVVAGQSYFLARRMACRYSLTVLEDVGEGKAMPEVEKELKDLGVFLL